MATSAETILANLQALGFTNVSVTSIEGIIAIAIGQVDDIIILEIQNSESTISNLLIGSQGYGKSAYYTDQALLFQYGDDLVINTAINPVTGLPYENLIYPVLDTTKQIIKQAAFQASVSGGSLVLFLKVATDIVSGTGLSALSNVQLAAFQSYMLNFEIVGIPLNIISLPGDLLFFTSVATYISSFDLPTLQTNLTAALNSFLTGFQFNGEFYVTDLQQYIMANVPGMRSFFVNNTELNGVGFIDFINLNSGYFNYDPVVFSSIVFNPVIS